MKDEKINSCGCGEVEENCGCGCGCDDNHEEHHEHCGCGCGDEEAGETILVDLQDENGNNVTCEVIDEFDYKDKTYALVQNPENDSVYLFREESQGDEVELVNPDENEFEEVTAYYETLQ
ncbi:hypothetical protein ACP49_15025 [Clostridium botulinum]|uniref:DUF1292 domain-containing protein n=1 Tax=Clostridium botulinum TaxID=1491 RepID=A0ABD7CIP5_CLOBO|nr:DUF1292 domain-containing protein [Clostridium botulinum]KEI85571.1 hypothetical protein N491_14725 [Clostridium botulinum B2 275]KEI88032.1 hypothetical protein N492_14045 [Clostridium botulinum B2 267]KGO14135.1 hypothetical protein NZ45_08655 [Clostridium botulinum]KIN81329.1 hypothetical protein SD74_09390 [Clostridium botulinum]KOM96859.1 hypothetical protein ACP53_10200 [Clostridium botulinum]